MVADMAANQRRSARAKRTGQTAASDTARSDIARSDTARSDTDDAGTPSTSRYQNALIQLIRQDEWTMGLLSNVRSLGLDDWCIAAGTIRNLVWDDAHSHADKTYPGDIDVLIFDEQRTTASYETGLEQQLAKLDSHVRWEVTNQATIHTYVGDDSGYASIEDAMSRWADLVTAVGVWLSEADELVIVSPDELDDLFELRVRPNLITPTSAATYRSRTTGKGWQEQWPLLDIELLPSSEPDDRRGSE